jgi:hypothetical protein
MPYAVVVHIDGKKGAVILHHSSTFSLNTVEKCAQALFDFLFVFSYV